MSKPCEFCFRWKPQNWNGFEYTDDEAVCALDGVWRAKDYTCEKGSTLIIGEPTQLIKKKLQKGTTNVVAHSHHHNKYNDVSVISEEHELYEHQKVALEKFKDATVIPIFWKMGLGKSAVILKIAEHKYNSGQIDSLLIISPTGVHIQWAYEQIPLWLKCDYECQCVGGQGKLVQRDTHPFAITGLHVLCVNIDTFSTKDKYKEILEWAVNNKTLVVLDEATCVKNVSALRTERLLYGMNAVTKRGKSVLTSVPKTVARAILTGTPVTNSPNDAWALMEFVKPNFFNRSYYSFKNYFGMYSTLGIKSPNGKPISVPLSNDSWEVIKRCNDFNEANALTGCSQDTFFTVQSQDKFMGYTKHGDELRAALHDAASFLEIEEVLDMPERNTITRFCEMDNELRNVYNQMKKDMYAVYCDKEITALNKITAITRLRQICSGFVVSNSSLINYADIDDEHDYNISEISWVGESNNKLKLLYNDVKEVKKPVIIITQYIAEALRIYQDLCDTYKCCLMTGWKKVGTLEEYKNGDYEVMVANERVISRGHNLQNGCVIMFYSNSASLEDRLQTEGRIYRSGQKNTCLYYDYVYKDSVDVDMIGCLQHKRNYLRYISDTDMKELLY